MAHCTNAPEITQPWPAPQRRLDDLARRLQDVEERLDRLAAHADGTEDLWTLLGRLS